MKNIHDIIGWFSDTRSVMVALSGGVDSALVAYAAHNSPNTKAIAVTADYMTLAKEELQSAKSVARQIGIKHHIIQYSELEDENFTKNDKNRCYHCRTQMGQRLQTLAHDMKYDTIVDGTNADDVTDYRPGMRAIAEHDIQSPLLHMGITKSQIREFARQAGLDVHDRPSNSCLASRIPWGRRITAQMLVRVEMAEKYVRGVVPTGHVRVRDMDGTARIEVSKNGMRLIQKDAKRLTNSLQLLGFKTMTVREYVTGGANSQ